MNKGIFAAILLLLSISAYSDPAIDPITAPENARKYYVTITINPLTPIASAALYLLDGDDPYAPVPFRITLFPSFFVSPQFSYFQFIPMRDNLPAYYGVEFGLKVPFLRSVSITSTVFYYASVNYHYEWGRKRLIQGDVPVLDVLEQTGYVGSAGMTVIAGGFTIEFWGGILIFAGSKSEAIEPGYSLQTDPARFIYGLDIGWSF